MLIALWVGVFVIATIALVKSADFFTDAAERIGFAYRIPSFVIGGTIVAFGTSLPELASSLSGVFQGASDIVIANVIGSNISNIALILGVTAIVAGKRINVTRELVDVDLPIMIGAAMLLALTVWDGTFSRFEALIMVGGLLLYMFFVMYGDDRENIDLDEEVITQNPRGSVDTATVLALIASGTALYFSAKYVVGSVIELSDLLHLNTSIIALYAIALGTSLPELVVSVGAARKGKGELAVGNILGSNIFNIFAVMGIPGLVGTLVIPQVMITTYLPLMLLASLLYYFIAQDKSFTKWEGYLLLLFYLLFLGMI